MAGEMLVSTDECAGMDGGHSIDTDGNARDEGDKILTAGPSAWESTKKNLVGELRVLVRARDMALAEQRTRHLKESVVIREQRHALETAGPAFSKNIAKLFGWADSVGERKSSSPTSVSPVSVSPGFSRFGSPTGSPPGAQRKRYGNWSDDPVFCAQVGSGALVTTNAADAAVAGTRDAESQQQPPSASLGVVDELGMRILEDETFTIQNALPRKQSAPAGMLYPDVPSAPDANNDEGGVVNQCPRCMRLRHERDMAITERNLVEVELVSIRREISQVDTAWDRKAEFKSRNAVGRGDTASETDKGDKTAPISPCGEADSSNHDLGLREEASRLEKLASLSEDGPPPPDLDTKGMDTEGLPVTQESALILDGDEAQNSSKMLNLAASLSAAVTNRARHFEELSRRRLLRLGVEADLREARVKLDSLFGSAMTASLQGPSYHSKGDDPRETRGKDRETCGGVGAPSPPGGFGAGDTMEAKGTGNDKNNNRDNDVGVSSPNHDSSVRGKGSRVKGEARSNVKQKMGTQRLGRGAGKNRGSATVPLDADTIPFRAFREMTTTRKAPKVTTEESPPTSRGDTQVANSTIGARNRRRKGARDPLKKATDTSEGGDLKEQENVRAQRTANDSAVERDNASIVAADDNAKDAGRTNKRTSCIEQAANERGNNCGQSPSSSGIQAPGENGEAASKEESPPRNNCPTSASVAEEAGVVAGAQRQPLGSGGASVNDETVKISRATKKNASVGNVTQVRSPRASPRRPKDAPKAAARLRRVPSPPRDRTSSSKGDVAHSPAAKEVAAAGNNHETPDADDSDSKMPANASHVISGDNPGEISAAAEEGVETRGTALQSEGFPDGEGTTGEILADAVEDVLHAGVPETEKHIPRDKDIIPKKDALPKAPPKQNRARAAQGAFHGKGGKGNLAKTRLAGKTAKIKTVPRAVGGAPTRLGSTMKARRLTQDGSLAARASVDPDFAAREAEKAEGTKADEENGLLLAGDVAESASCVQVTGEVAGEGDLGEEGRGRSTTNDGEGEVKAPAGPTQTECPSVAHHMLEAGSEEEPVVVERPTGIGEVGEGTGGHRDGLIVAPEEQIPGHTDGSDKLPFPTGLADLAEALRIEVDTLRLEKAELEDTVAQLNVAAAQLYIVEYQQMKAKCRQLKRVLGPASRPTEVESAFGHSCQEIMHRLKTIGVNFFRRRIGGVMGEQFFPDGLSGMLRLIGRERVAQGCQTAPLERLGSLGKHGAFPALPGSRDVYVQVAGGIDAEDEPLMEQQVYALLGRLDLLLKRREDVLSSYHREAAEGAREARALLALAAAQHHPGQAWGVSRPPNARPLIGGREGPAGAPRPAINPTNLLFSAAAVLDSVAATNAVNHSPDSVSTSKPTLGETSKPTLGEIGSAGGNGESRRRRFSAAEKALLELADEVVAALESEQRRSDASAERRRFVADRHNSRSGRDTQALGRPPMGVPPLIWAMEIHLVGKLARAFRTAVEARGFEREVEDANLVAAVTLGRSSSPSAKGAGKSDDSSPWHLGHRMLSVLRGEDGEGGGTEEGVRLQTPQRDLANGSKEGLANSRRENPQFDWGNDTYSPRKTPHRSASCGGGTDRRRTYHSSPAPSPRKAEGSAHGEQSRRQAIKGRAGIRDGHRGPTPNPSGSPASNKASAAIARVEAAVFDTVRPSRLHPRPGSASVAGRSDRAGHAGCGASATTERLRPQSARLAEPRHPFPGGSGRSAFDEQNTAAYRSSPPDVHRDERRAYQVDSTSESCTTAVRRQQPLRPTPTAATAGRRPASAGGRVVDTRIWSSNNKVVEARAGVFRCRPNKAVRGASVQFESAAAGGGVSGLLSSPYVPTHSGEVPEFLRRKEVELIKAVKEKQAAANGRFTIVPDDKDRASSGGGEGSMGVAKVEHHPDEIWRHPSDGQKRLTRASESRDGREDGEDATLVEQSDTGGGSDDGYGGRVLSSLRIEDSMDGEGLLPDAGEQAFFDAWKPTGYGIDLSRYD